MEQPRDNIIKLSDQGVFSSIWRYSSIKKDVRRHDHLYILILLFTSRTSLQSVFCVHFNAFLILSKSIEFLVVKPIDKHRCCLLHITCSRPFLLFRPKITMQKKQNHYNTMCCKLLGQCDYVTRLLCYSIDARQYLMSLFI